MLITILNNYQYCPVAFIQMERFRVEEVTVYCGEIDEDEDEGRRRRRSADTTGLNYTVTIDFTVSTQIRSPANQLLLIHNVNDFEMIDDKPKKASVEMPNQNEILRINWSKTNRANQTH